MGNKEKTTKILIGLIAVLIVGIGFLTWMVVDLKNQNKHIGQQHELVSNEKELVKLELTNLLEDYESLSTNNDSLNYQLEKEKEHIKELISEVERIKNINASQINKYKKELETLRQIMKHYVYQIDSLNILNQNLMAENINIKKDKQELEYMFDEVVEQNAEYEVVVEKASMIKSTNINIEFLNKRGKETSRTKKISKLKINFTMLENSLASQGNKIVYLRIINPEGLVISSGQTMEVNEQALAYSASRQILYEGSNLDIAIYFDDEDVLAQGTYKAELYVDGYLMGEKSFLIGK
ncbi:MAG: hypothetical protein GX879_05805 [Bacteroidales bacterium]|nr:hypothetical protein [Bacteroidales bacterium]